MKNKKPRLRIRASIQQYGHLIEFMESNGDPMKLQPGPEAREQGARLWQQLAKCLNSVAGGVHKSPEKWKKVWIDWKCKTKKKSLRSRRYTNVTGVITDEVTLTDLEERVLAVLGVAVLEHAPAAQECVWFDNGHHNEASSNEAGISPSNLSGLDSERVLDNRNKQNFPAASENDTIQRLRRRRRLQTPYQKTFREFTTVQLRRVRADQRREHMRHEREMKRLRQENRRLDVKMEINQLLYNLANIGQNVLNILRTVT